ncbi:MAG TPA: HAMP domain-containing sensor histidine kinase [Dehalococcoidia bacterium]|nr:HAMP domain-containing sensor histidine kinase [Dehalococcoidia bacterium]
MRARLRGFVFSFQTKLVLAMAGVMLLALLLAGAVFVARTRHERREQALDRVAAASPAIYQQAFFALVQQDQSNQQSFSNALDALAKEQDVRILLVDNTSVVLHDTGAALGGTLIQIPRSTPGDLQRGYVAWEPAGAFPEHNLTLVAASGHIVTSTGRPLPFRIILAVKTDTLASAWLGVLPGLGLAGLIAMPLALLATLALARQVAQPVRKLTAASEAMARGDFDQRVEVSREDEVGRLARSFTVMAEHVGERESQMRALLANVSHDLKTPMTSITGYAQALKDGTADAGDVAHIAEVITEEAQHVNALLGDLLYLGEIDAGEVVTRHEDAPLEGLVSRCVRRIEPRTRAKAIAVTVDLSEDTTMSGVDPDKLERALTNVLDNAAKFTPEGGTIAVRGWRENGSSPPRVVCAVTNSGTSINPDDLPRVFDRFFRGDRARRTASGSGLGLAITRQLVELNGGTVEATNDPAGGVTFRLALPA